eukprot:CAMPEP_0201568910 /NCGR_PEP_ID=MMETSP0190_2-20130828/10251_1 /ASSEMBLY_ACC=CAM_ASM_000263 /TAXON_ID=37353 /ORGANISM="Rosalina sp." /LENGTH=453 /DNA_ID=CAMNT_0047990593 /DNA_START=87 /DNA_END=1448 /DNA_ORIENTATION=-
MSSKKFKGLTTEEQLQDLLLKHEALEQEVNVFVLENREYKKDINELKERNSQLMEDNAAYQQLLQFEQQEITFTHERLSTLKDVDLDNIDLNQQLKEYKQLLKQLKLENISIKNENKKYKLALENYDQQKQKREEIYTNNKLNLDNKIKELQEENESLRIDISTMSINPYQYLVANGHGSSNKTTGTHSRKHSNAQHDQSEEKQYEERNYSNNGPTTPYGILRIKGLKSPGPTPGPFPGTTPGPVPRPLTDRSTVDENDVNANGSALPVFNDFRSPVFNEYSHSHSQKSQYTDDHFDLSRDNHDNRSTDNNNHDVDHLNVKVPNGYPYDPEFDEEGDGTTYVGYATYKYGQQQDIDNLSRKSMSNLMASVKGSSTDDVLHINGLKQSVTKEIFDTDILLAKIEQVKKLREVNEDYETKIEELEDEVKLLRQQNHQLIQRLDGGFRCVALRWFS